MRHKRSKLFLTTLITGALSIGPALSSQGAQESVTLFVKSLSIDKLTLDVTKNAQSVTLVGILKSAVSLKPEDLQCGESKSRSITISALGNDFYRVVCVLNYGRQDTPIRELTEVAIEISDDNSNFNWQMAPLNSNLLIAQTAKDGFGIVRTNKVRLYGYPGTSMFFAALIAMNPPSDYKAPSFAVGQDGYLIFDVADVPATKPIILFSKDKKVMSLKCPIPVTKVSSQVKKQAQVTFWINNKLVNPAQMLGNWFDSATFNKVLIEKSLKGKSAKIFCATKYVIPESNVVLAYAESTEATVQIPK